MRKFCLALTLLSLSLSTLASAEESHSGAPEEQKACIRDVQKFCRPVIDQGDFTVLACLKIGLIRTPSALADSIGFGIVFPYMGNTIPSRAAKDGGSSQPTCPDNVVASC
jgi:hypothetical protein